MGKLLDAVRSGDKRDTLVALRDKIAATIEDTSSGRDMAALAKRLIEIDDMIDALPKDGAYDPVDAMIADTEAFYADD